MTNTLPPTRTAIIIPARYGSTRFPGKPLAEIGGKSMLAHVAEIGRQASEGRDDVDLLVATEAQRIADHARELGLQCVMTPDDCPTGSDRVLEATNHTDQAYDILISLQGDAPFTPVAAISSLLDKLDRFPATQVATPVIRLGWAELDQLRAYKQTTPFSGTTAIVDEKGYARWFSKTIIPAIRKEEELRETQRKSPVFQHLGVYAYRREILEKFVNWPQGYYEQLEGLEQLRFLENDIPVDAVEIAADAGIAQMGIDSPQDLDRAQEMLSNAQNEDD